MRIGIPAEIMNQEGRVSASPQAVASLLHDGHTVLVQRGAGAHSSFTDADYEAAGAVLGTAEEAWACELVLKVKEPQPEEYRFLRRDLILFTYLHLAASPELARALTEAGTTAIAYETVTDAMGGLPLLTPMSQVAGRLAVLAGAHHLQSTQGGRGVLLSGIPGTPPGKVVVIGGGHVGASAVAMAAGLRAEVTVLDISARVLERFDDVYQGRVRTVLSDPAGLAAELADADLVIGAVLVAGAKAPVLVSDAMVATMRPGSVLVDVAIDQGGCFESSRKTSYSDPTFTVGETVFYCVPNMPGAVAHTSTRALSAATSPYVRATANLGVDGAIEQYPGLAGGINVRDGEIVNAAVARALG